MKRGDVYELTYLNQKGKHQRLYKILYKKLVPKNGPAETKAGEILRITSLLYMDVFKHGGERYPEYVDERVQLIILMPAFAKTHTNRFISRPSLELGSTDSYKRFMDSYMDFIVMYVKALDGYLSIAEVEK